MGTLPSRLFEPDIIVPSQFFATSRRYAPRKRGEYRLLVAVLKEAIECFQENAHARNKWQQQRFDEVQRWVAGEDRDAVGPEDQVPGFSFEYVCDVLGLDAAHLRRGLQRWRARTCAIADAKHAESGHRAGASYTRHGDRRRE